MGRKKSTLACLAAATVHTASASMDPSSRSLQSISHPAFVVPRGGSASSADEPKKRKRRFKKNRQKKGGTDKPPSDEPSHSTKERESEPSPARPEPQTPPIVEEILKESDYYKILGTTRQEVSKNQNVIKKAYRRRAVQTHPDKTEGDRRAFDKVAKAYEVLSDDSKRKIYDRYGEAGLENGGGGFAHGAEDLFRSFFGGSGGKTGDFFSPPSRNKTVRYQLDVRLEEIYKGITQSVSISSPGMSPFSNRQRQSESKTVEVVVPRGAQDGESIVLSGEMDFDSSNTPGDVIFLVKQRRHPVFTRRGYDLAVVVKISLKDSICGVSHKVQHLDGRTITVTSRDPKSDPRIVESGDVQVMKGEGMPKDASGREYGDLYIQYEVTMPTTGHPGALDKDERKELGRLLDKLEGKSPTAHSPEPGEGVVLTDATVEDFGVASGVPPPPEQHFQEEENSSSRFFFPSSRGSNPFFAHQFEDDGQTQCQHM